jgi:hypothetical protein
VAVHLLYVYDGGSIVYPAAGGIATTTNISSGYVTQSLTFSVVITNDATALTLKGAWTPNETAGTDVNNEIEAIRIA